MRSLFYPAKSEREALGLGNFGGMQRHGLTKIGILMSLLVVGLALLILTIINRQVVTDRDRSGDIRKMRAIFVAISLYSAVNNELPPPSLAPTFRDISNPEIYLASGDVYTKGNDFPVDPAFPNSWQRSSFRISFTYLPQWALNNKYQIGNWQSAYQNSSLGLIACYWSEGATTSRPDGLDSNGDIIRINMDGSAKTIQSPKGRGLLDAKTLFVNK